MGDNMKIVQLAEGRAALLLAPDQISEKRRRPVMEAIPLDIADSGDGDTEARKMTMKEIFPMLDQLILCMVHSWNLKDDDGNPLPLTLENVLDLPGKQYDKLRNAVQPHMNAVIPNFGVSDDDKSPTVRSDGSEESSSPEAVPTQAANLPIAG